MSKKILIVGAGLAGSAMATLMARRGFAVEVYEKRPDPRRVSTAAGRSINLGLSTRGLKALATLDLEQRVSAEAVPMRGRVIHGRDGRTKYQPYGKDQHHALLSVEREKLNALLIERADAHDNVRFVFDARFTALETGGGPVARFATADGVVEAGYDLLIGADGSFSTVRRLMQIGQRADYHREFLSWGYKELRVPVGAEGKPQLELEALHVWPRGDCLLLTHANRDGSHTASFFMPWEGETSFRTLDTEPEVEAFFARTFPDLLARCPELPAQFLARPTASLVTVRTSRWWRGDSVVLIGDACHAVYPFYGQGMNAALEDCSALAAAIDRHPDEPATAFAEYQAERRPNTDALAQLSKDNFRELASHLTSPFFVLRKKADVWLARLLPAVWQPLYSMIVHSTMPYLEALRRYRKQTLVLNTVALLSVTAAVLLAVL